MKSEHSMHGDSDSISRPLHRRGLYDDPRLEDKFRRRVEMFADRPPSKFSRKLQAANYTMMFGVGIYMLLYLDYGPRRNCFTSLREWYFGKVDRLWTLSKDEEKDLREQGRIK
ncbi:hypothetical protein IW136_000698 [Coemansia sp. RSA 678]|nr:hypothetical protein IW136_000698 [Coemansia sp. RSA 678]